jgi:hypothetical protein
MRRALLLPGLLLVVAGCAEERAGTPAPAADGATGRLVVHKALAGSPVFIEGSLTRLRITAPDGRRIDAGPTGTSLGAPLFERALPAGAYTVRAVERPCDGNCGYLDPPVPSTRCSVDVRVRPGRATHVDIVLAVERERAVTRCRAR